MKAWIISDIHLFRMMGMKLSPPFAIPEADVCICAGDVSSDLDVSLSYLMNEVAPHMPVVFTLGNHEYYGRSIKQAIDQARRATVGTGVHLLENDVIEIDGVLFIGATLWTDFEIATGDGDEDIPAELRLEIARKDIRQHVMDFTEIKSNHRPGQFVNVNELRDRHAASRDFIRNQLEGVAHGQTSIVVTHHAPLMSSLDGRFSGNLSNAAYASDLSTLIEAGRPNFWIHGHVHQSHDYVFDHTRIICNPRGTNPDNLPSGFSPELVIEI